MSPSDDRRTIQLDGSALSIEDLVRVARDPGIRVAIAEEALARVDHGRAAIESLIVNYKAEYAKLEKGKDGHPVLDYGVTTGFGEFKNIAIDPDDLLTLQRNILLSHTVGVGETADELHPANFFDPEVVRAALVIRLNAFLKGFSGVRRELVATVQAMINHGIVPLVPIRGSVGSSGDLCPLSHLFVVLLGENRWFVVETPDDLKYQPRKLRSGRKQLARDLGMKKVPEPSYKEGLALTNGATFSAALLALAVHDAEHAVRVADAACALALEAVCGCARAFDPRIHEARGHAGQIASAAHIRSLLAGSTLIERAGAVQDVYSLRCAPAVHGAARDTLDYARRVAAAEINAATDNPLFFPAGDGATPWDHEFAANWPEGYSGREKISFSAGNFHGQPVGVAADCLAIAVAELADISERRTQMLLDGHHNRNLPANLVPCRGVSSGFMIAQYTAAGVVSENKILAHPASVDSIPTSANSEDHNAMATIACRKLRTVLRNVQTVLAIELLVAAQAVEWRVGMDLDPRPPQGGVEGTAAPSPADRQRAEKAEARAFAAAVAPKRREKIAGRLGAGTGPVYSSIRKLVLPLLADRTLDGDVRAVRAAIEANALF
jgi:histidine ammonia-lyase